MEYNFDRVPNRRQPGVANKWTLFPPDVLPMWIADMDFAAPPSILNALGRHVKHGDMGYQLPSQALLESIVARMDQIYNWKISTDMIVPISGVNSGYNVAVRTFCTSRHGYLIQTPVYNEFHETQKKTGVPQLEAPLAKQVVGNRIRYEADFDALKRAVRKSNLFLLCNPHNPVGRLYSHEELKSMAQICLENNVLIVSDEIHSELLLDGNKFNPIACLGSEVANRTITLISASKTFNVPGLFCAFAIIPNAELRKSYIETVFKMGIHINSPGLVASRVAYSGRCDAWLKALRKYLTGNRDFLVDYIEKYIPQMRITIPEATYLAWMDCSEFNLEPSPCEFFLKHARVALGEGRKFGEESAQFVRLNFGTSRRLLKRGLDRMNQALNSR
jgi:cystathionine beta-lyase